MYLKIRIIGILYLLLVLTICTKDEPIAQEQENEDTDEQDQDFLKVTLTIDQSDESLVIALAGANSIAQDVKKVVIDACESDDLTDCEQTVQIGTSQIEAKYNQQDGQSTFETFKVSHEVTITLQNQDSIGKVIDSVLKCKITQITSFEWIPQKEKDPMKDAVKQGIEKAKVLCKALKLKYKETLSVQQLEMEEADEQDQDAEDPPLIYKFEVSCDQSSITSQKPSKTKK